MLYDNDEIPNVFCQHDPTQDAMIMPGESKKRYIFNGKLNQGTILNLQKAIFIM